MRKLLTLTAAAAFALAVGFAGAAGANHTTRPDEYADTVVDFGRDAANAPGPHGPANPELNALGEEDGTGSVGWFNLGSGTDDEGGDNEGFIIVRFDNNVLIPDGTVADDLTVWEASFHSVLPNDLVDVFVSANGVDWVFVGQARNRIFDVPGNPTFPNHFDVDPTGLSFVRYVKLVNQVTGIGAAGFDTDAIEALNNVIEHINPHYPSELNISCGDDMILL